jgi:hypothetical protein
LIIVHHKRKRMRLQMKSVEATTSTTDEEFRETVHSKTEKWSRKLDLEDSRD